MTILDIISTLVSNQIFLGQILLREDIIRPGSVIEELDKSLVIGNYAIDNIEEREDEQHDETTIEKGPVFLLIHRPLKMVNNIKIPGTP